MIIKVEYLKGLPPGVWKDIKHGKSRADSHPTGYSQLPEETARGYREATIRVRSGLAIPEHYRPGLSQTYIVIAGSGQFFTRGADILQRQEDFLSVGDSLRLDLRHELRVLNDGRRGDLYLVRIARPCDGRQDAIESMNLFEADPVWTEEIIPSE